MKCTFIIIVFVCWSATANNVEFPISYMNESLHHLCEDKLISFNFSNVITNINQNFISSPLITCLNLTDNNIQKIRRGAFNKLPNLTQLYLSNNRFSRKELFNFGGHYKLQVLVINNGIANNQYYNGYEYTTNHRFYNGEIYYGDKTVPIFDEYSNLEILSLRKNDISNLYFSPEKTPFFDSPLIYTPASTTTQKTPFPKLKSLDLSENSIRRTDFFKWLPSLHFLDLHDNKLEILNLETASQLFALNLDSNHFKYINKNWNEQTLSLGGLKNLHYLSVSRNNILEIESNAFQDNNKLVYLNLSVNDISYINPETFANLQDLKILDLSRNKLEHVPKISNEIGINILYINHNNITKLMSRIFVQMPKLTKLLLGENEIDEIDVNAFANLSVLEELDLSRNMLNSLPEGWTESLVSLKYLDLSSNQFTSLESLALSNTLPLIKIYLMLNPLEYLNVRYFESLPQNLTIILI